MKNFGAIYLQHLFSSEAKLKGHAMSGSLVLADPLEGASSHTRARCDCNRLTLINVSGIFAWWFTCRLHVVEAKTVNLSGATL